MPSGAALAKGGQPLLLHTESVTKRGVSESIPLCPSVPFGGVLCSRMSKNDVARLPMWILPVAGRRDGDEGKCSGGGGEFGGGKCLEEWRQGGAVSESRVSESRVSGSQVSGSAAGVSAWESGVWESGVRECGGGKCLGVWCLAFAPFSSAACGAFGFGDFCCAHQQGLRLLQVALRVQRYNKKTDLSRVFVKNFQKNAFFFSALMKCRSNEHISLE